MNILRKELVLHKPVNPTDPIKFLMATGIGIVMGYLGLSNGVIAVIYAGISIFPIFFAFQNNVEKVLTTIPYFVYVEIYFRASGNILPYLYCPYVLIAVFGLLILRKGIVFKIYSRAFVFLFLFALVEIFNATRTNSPDVARSSITLTLFILIVSLWSSSTKMTTNQINIFIKNMKMAGLWLCGYILAAHILGTIKYNLASSFESTNGLAPVQISAYLGFLSFLFFLPIVNNSDQRNMAFNIGCLLLSSTLMVLSFSRGGVYFIGILITFYFIFNAKRLANYFMFLLLVPIGSLIYYFVGEVTGGLVAQRFSEEGASGRDILVKIGFQIFLKNPVAGIGTGNFNSEIVKEQLYALESGAHNEFIRVMAEHGVLGLLTYWGFYIMLFIEIMLAKGIKREYSFYFFVLFILIIIHNGLKIGLQPMILLLTIAIPHSANGAKHAK